MKKKALIITALTVLLVAGGTLAYVEDYYHADEAAQAALVSDQTVSIEKMDYGWFFDGPSDEKALIFYPGGKVEETAYAPLLHMLAENGIDAALVSMPARLAVLAGSKGEKVLEQYEYPHWLIAGHSLGGVMAASVAAAHDQIEALVLLASYSTRDLGDLLTILIYGSRDGVLNMKKYHENRSMAPNSIEHVIEGGNHAGFGSYGKQKNDGEASISSAEQIAETVSVILQAVGSR